jgi:hypothetical protein
VIFGIDQVPRITNAVDRPPSKGDFSEKSPSFPQISDLDEFFKSPSDDPSDGDLKKIGDF